jgi:hypothetical protein
LSEPTAGWDNTTDNFTTTSASQTTPYPVGTKILGYSSNPENPGFYTMQYLMFTDFSAIPIDADFSTKVPWCSHADFSTAEKYASDTSAVPYYVVSHCYTAISSDITKGQPMCLPCATLDGDGTAVQVTGYGDAYGWFWVEGVCPLNDVSLFRGAADTSKGFDFTVDSLMRGGPLMVCMTATVPWLSSDDATNYADSTAFTNALAAIGGKTVAYSCTSCV